MIESNTNTMDRIAAMRAQEEAIECRNYFKINDCKDVDESSRRSMVAWCQQVQTSLNLSPETAWIATSYFDRYLSSGRGKSREALEDRHKFQLAAIAAFYTAVDIYEPAELSVSDFSALCQDDYEASDILSTEEDILSALDWRVSCPTPMDFARKFLELLPEKMNGSISENLLKGTEKYVERAAKDFYFSRCKPSVVGACCLASCLVGGDILSSSERRAFWLRLARVTDLIDVMAAQNRLLNGRTPRKPIAASEVVTEKTCVVSKLSHRKAVVARGNSSPVRVTRAARQA